MDIHEPALALTFEVRIDGVDIGTFSACEGLNAEYEVEEIKEGGNNGFVHRLPGRLKYQNIKLTRAIDGDSGKLAGWFASLQDGADMCTASITALDGQSRKLASWSLRDVWPVKYSGPQLNASTNGVANEVLELVHHGFSVRGA